MLFLDIAKLIRACLRSNLLSTVDSCLFSSSK